ncbi:hypothetical protein T4D_15408 [Trichinella pseudospiralis]|uniref:Uncharacterized protein n=1 Tax=Trichinella pseudospiralis TaxID=6337 RepID=A0A0V1FUN9_TRIPS|nr:hypothetical protein T4D_15408 [Trichinella pseudospiralis]
MTILLGFYYVVKFRRIIINYGIIIYFKMIVFMFYYKNLIYDIHFTEIILDKKFLEKFLKQRRIQQNAIFYFRETMLPKLFI